MPPLLSVDEALRLVLGETHRLGAERVPLARALGRTLAAAVRADADHPPFPRSRVDGWAIRTADAPPGGATLRVVAEIAAGTPPGASIGPGEAARIFTGAAVPAGADAVVKQEGCDDVAGPRRHVRLRPGFEADGHIVPVGTECRAGQVVAAAGDVVTSALVGALASVGAATLDVVRRPSVRILATGNELVPCEETPGPGRIRNSNAPALAAAAAELGCDVLGTDWAGDDAGRLLAAVTAALDADVALITGGVSVGDFDLVPGILDQAGVGRVFHGVRLQPGKPIWFGVRAPQGATGRRTLVFALPGNPVSTLVNTALFVRPAVAALCGRAAPAPRAARLGGPVGAGTGRQRYVPARLELVAGAIVATPVPFQGSGDVFGFSRADALIVVPEGVPGRVAGEAAEIVVLGGASAGAGS